MKDWVAKICESKYDFTKEFICIIPSQKTRHAYERKVLEHVPYLHRVHFMTCKEWVLYETEQYVVNEGMRLIDDDEIVRWVYEHILVEGSLRAEQKRLSTAQAIVTEMLLIRENGLAAHIVNEGMRPLFEQLFEAYDRFLADKQAVDYTSLLRYLLEKEHHVTAHVIVDHHVQLKNLERELVSLYGINVTNDEVTDHPDPLEKLNFVESYGFSNGVEHAITQIKASDNYLDEMYFVYTHADLLQPIYDKVKQHQLPATFASGIPIRFTEAYFFLETIVQYIENKEPVQKLKQLVNGNIFDLDKQIFNALQAESGVTTGERLVAAAKKVIADGREQRIVNEDADAKEKIDTFIERITALNKLVGDMQKRPKDTPRFLRQLIEAFFRNRSKREAIAASQIKDVLTASEYIYLSDKFIPSLTELLALVSVQSLEVENEKPGHLHVSLLDDVGPLYRKRYYWFGMSMESFYIHGDASPFIAEEKLLEAGMQVGAARLLEKEKRFEQFMMNKSVEHTLYFSVKHLERLQDNNPIKTYRMYRELAKESVVKVGYPKSALGKERPADISLHIEELPAKKALYKKAEEEKELLRLSASKATELIGCSRKFMYEEVLRLKDDTGHDIRLDSWLANNLRGNLHHEILELYMQRRDEAGAREDALQSEIINKVFAEYERLYPATYAQLIEREKERANKIIHMIEEEFDEAWEFVVAESAFGMEKEQPFFLELPDGKFIQMSGFIDRVDKQKETDLYRVMDYKTGKRENADALQITLYEEAYKQQYGHEVAGSQFEFISGEDDDGKVKKTSLEVLMERLGTFEEDWDLIDYQEIKKSNLCNYCSFQHVCAFRDGDAKKGGESK